MFCSSSAKSLIAISDPNGFFLSSAFNLSAGNLVSCGLDKSISTRVNIITLCALLDLSCSLEALSI